MRKKKERPKGKAQTGPRVPCEAPPNQIGKNYKNYQYVFSLISTDPSVAPLFLSVPTLLYVSVLMFQALCRLSCCRGNDDFSRWLLFIARLLCPLEVRDLARKARVKLPTRKHVPLILEKFRYFFFAPY